MSAPKPPADPPRNPLLEAAELFCKANQVKFPHKRYRKQIGRLLMEHWTKTRGKADVSVVPIQGSRLYLLIHQAVQTLPGDSDS